MHLYKITYYTGNKVKFPGVRKFQMKFTRLKLSNIVCRKCHVSGTFPHIYGNFTFELTFLDH